MKNKKVNIKFRICNIYGYEYYTWVLNEPLPFNVSISDTIKIPKNKDYGYCMSSWPSQVPTNGTITIDNVDISWSAI